jgi:hypothetical protein
VFICVILWPIPPSPKRYGAAGPPSLRFRRRKALVAASPPSLRYVAASRTWSNQSGGLDPPDLIFENKM